jgi:hypothetical protein
MYSRVFTLYIRYKGSGVGFLSQVQLKLLNFVCSVYYQASKSGRWIAKMVERLLAKAALWVRILTYSKIKIHSFT